MRLRQPFLLLLLSCTLAAPSAFAQSPPVPVTPASATWFSPPNNPLLRAAWMLGAEKQAGAYLLRVVLAEGGRIAPHTHPDARVVTVLDGTLFVAFGAKPGDADMVPVSAGSVYVVPANMAHALWAKEGDVTYQETGIGPTGNSPIAEK